ncbi:MAG: putative transporter [Bacteroidaceae bacterium]|nr:putative transporter [Bacteroidaceae bacterium]
MVEFFTNMFAGNPAQWGGGVAHSVLILSLVIALGVMLGKIKIAGVSFGVTWILFVGILFGHFGFNINEHLLHFVKEFGLILFVYSVGLQVGPGFFSAFRKGGLSLNMVAMTVVFVGVLLTIALHYITGLPITTMVGVLSGAVTNTPGLGAAQQAVGDITGGTAPEIAMAYAVAYPLGVIGCILSLLLMRYVFRVDVAAEDKASRSIGGGGGEQAVRPYSIVIRNVAVDGKRLSEVEPLLHSRFVVSRISEGGSAENIRPAAADTVLHVGDKVLVITTPAAIDSIVMFLGELCEMNWEGCETRLISRRVLITKPELNGKMLSSLKIRNNFGVNITRVNRSGVDLVANPHLRLQMGDRVTIVGSELSIAHAEKVLGNSLKRLDHPNLIPIFIGIALGCLLGSIPFVFPGIPQPVKLGLAGGPLIVAILVSRFGPNYKLVTYTTMSANLMIREIGISLFLACVGLGAGGGFVDTIVNDGGYVWVGYGVLITVIPLLVAGFVARKFFKVNYYTLIGVLSGSMTNPPALAYSNEQTGSDAPSVGYATVYPLTMFLRVLTAQLLIIFFV